MAFSLFAVFSEMFEGIPPLVGGVRGVQKVHVYTPGRAHDPYLNDGAAPPLVLQFYFDTLALLEAACDGALQPIAPRCKVQAMRVLPFEVPEPAMPLCTYLVAYEGKAEDEAAWHAHYLANHPPLMARLPGIRELEIYLPVDWRSGPGWRQVRCMQRNKVGFDSAEALSAALNSPVRTEMRADYARLPPFSGRVTHYPMATSVLSSA
ncbi:MAG TPA: EthD family reductase [Burkholderiales bacterium]